MVAYFDTSAFIPLIVEEPGSSGSTEIWKFASQIVSNRLLFVEAHSAIARMDRDGVKSASFLLEGADEIRKRWTTFQVLEFTENLMLDAAKCATRFGLRGYDAAHCAAAASINGPDLVAASSDQRLLEAWSELGVATFDPCG